MQNADIRPGATRSVRGMLLRVSQNGRHLVDERGVPFFYLGDTVWTLLKRLDRAEVEEYLQNRAAKGFSVVQAYVLRGLNVPNLYGDLTLVDRDPTRPNDAFFQNVDYVVNRANEVGLVMGLVVCWGEHVRQVRTDEQVLTPTNAFAFGEYLGRRYRDNAVIWYLGGDREPAEGREVWVALAGGLKAGSAGTHLVSYHGPGNWATPSSSFWFHQEPWLDFNVIQSGHGWGIRNDEFVTHDYNLRPVKPTIDMESRYENHPDVRMGTGKVIDAHQVREAGYWAVLAGAAGHGYGCNDMWQLYDPQRQYTVEDYAFPYAQLPGNTPWRQAMDFAGARGVGLMGRLFRSREWWRLSPDQSIVAAGQGEGEDHIQAALADDGSLAVAYLPFGNPVTIQTNRIAGGTVRAWWYDPRTGESTAVGESPTGDAQTFIPPSSGEEADWVLVLEAPGARV